MEKNLKLSFEFNSKLAESILTKLADQCKSNVFATFDNFKKALNDGMKYFQQASRGSDDRASNVFLVQLNTMQDQQMLHFKLSDAQQKIVKGEQSVRS